MKRAIIAVAVLAVLSATGCNVQTVKTSTVSGTVLQLDDSGSLFPVRNAVVRTSAGTTRTSPSGAFSLANQPEGAIELVAEANQNGVDYRGRTTAFNTRDAATGSVNIVVGRVADLATVRGVVQDRSGNVLEGAAVYANPGVGPSVRTFTGRNGEYVLRDLVSGFNYQMSAGGQGYRSDQTDVTLGQGEDRVFNFVLSDPGTPALQPPTGLFATSWVSPVVATKSPKGDPYDPVRKFFGNKRPSTAKTSKSGKKAPGATHLVEIDLEWDAQQFPDLLGYGVYRARGVGGLVGTDFLPEPLGAYYVDLDLLTNSNYSYALTTLSSLYPDFADRTESQPSDVVVSETLAPLRMLSTVLNPLTFRWQAGSSADEFVVFLFDEFPGVGVSSIWNNATNRAIGTSFEYDGPQLEEGRTYYVIVIGLANGDESRTIGEVVSFRL